MRPVAACKQIRKARRREPKQPRIGHDEAVLARDGQGLPIRIDDETEGIPLLSPAGGARAGELIPW